ncbi:MAG: hypothetical protein WAV13_04510 [Thermodesulfovibrionales bacterium]
MPGWAVKNSGPLGDEEIDSLVDLIKKYEKTLAPLGCDKKRGRMGLPLIFCFVSVICIVTAQVFRLKSEVVLSPKSLPP